MPDTTEPEIKVTEDGFNADFSLSPGMDQSTSRFPNPALRRANESGGGRHHQRSHSIDTKDRTSPILGFGDRSWSVIQPEAQQHSDIAAATAPEDPYRSANGPFEFASNYARHKPHSAILSSHSSAIPASINRKVSSSSSSSTSTGSPDVGTSSPSSPRRSSMRLADRINTSDGSARRNASPARHLINTPNSPRLLSSRGPASHVRRMSADLGSSLPFRPPSPVYAPSSSPPTGPDPQHSWDSVWPRSSTPDRSDQIRRLSSPAPLADLAGRSFSAQSDSSNMSQSPTYSSDGASPAAATSSTTPQRPKARRPQELRSSSSSPVLRLSPAGLRDAHEPTKSPRRSLEHSSRSEPVLKVGFSPPTPEAFALTRSSSTGADLTPTSRVLSPATEAAPRLDALHALGSHRANGWPADGERSPSPASGSDPRKRNSSAIPLPHQLPLPNRTPSPRMSPASPRLPFSDPAALYMSTTNGSLSESPPKTRSFIAMPPRSGYELSDDPDDVGSEDGSNSERESVGTNDEDAESLDEYDDRTDEEDNGMDEDRSSITEDDEENTEGQALDRSPSVAGPQAPLDRPSLPKRPSLTRSNVVPPPINTSDPDVGTLELMGNAEESMRSLAAAQRNSPASAMLNYFNDDAEASRSAQQQSGDPQVVEAVSPAALGFDSANEAMEEDSEQSSSVENPEESLSTLERIFLFAKSDMAYHRVLVSHSLPDWIREVELSEAVEYIIPLLNGLASDEANVCAAFAPEIDRVMWFFLRNCPLIESGDEPNEVTADDGEERATRPRISATSFSTLLCALLLNQDTQIAGATQQSLVQLFYRLQKRDLDLTLEELAARDPAEVEARKAAQDLDSYVTHAAGRDGQSVPHEAYDFPESARNIIMTEMLDNVALALAQVNHGRGHGESEVAGADDSADTAHAPPADPNAQDINMQEEEMHATGYSTGTSPAMADTLSSSPADEDMTQPSNDSGPWSQSDGYNGNYYAGSEMHADIDEDEEAAVGRMASVSLLAALAADELIPQQQLLSRFAPEILKLTSDPAFYVRKEVATALGPLAKNMSVADVVEKVLPSLNSGIHDFNWHVRQAACFSLPTVLTRLDPALRRERTLALMRALVNDVSRQLRATALEIIGETIYMFHNDPDGVPPELIRFFLGEPFDMAPQPGDTSLSLSFDKTSDLEGTEALFADEEAGMEMDSDYRAQSETNERSLLSSFGFADNEHSATTAEPWDAQFNASGPERPLVMAFNFPAVVLTMGQNQWSVLKEKHAELCRNPAFKVRKSLAASLHELGKIIGSEATRDDLLPAAEHFLQDEASEVRAAVLESIDVFLSCLPQFEAERLLRSLLDMWSSGMTRDWRLRESLALHIPSMSKQFLLEDEEGSLVSLMQLALSDPISAVRDAGVLCVPGLYRSFAEHDQVIADGFLGMVSDLGDSPGYRLRIACLMCIKALVDSGIPRSSCELLLINRLSQMGGDAVVDVRIVLAKTVGIMCHKDELYAMPQSRSAELSALIAQLANDVSDEVREPVSGVLSEQELRTYRVSPKVMAKAGSNKLVLGPADGGPYRPANESDVSSDFFGNSVGRDSQVFQMDDDNDDVDVVELEQHADDENVEQEQSQEEEQGQDEGDFFEEPLQPADHLERSRAALLRAKNTPPNVTTLAGINSGWLSTNGTNLLDFSDVKTEYDDEPHHLLSVDSSGEQVNSDDDNIDEDDNFSHDDSDDSDPSVNLSSPQRGIDNTGNAGEEEETSPSRPAASSRKVSDPFLAFVAGRRSEEQPLAQRAIPNGSSMTQPMGGEHHSKHSGDWSTLSDTDARHDEDDDDDDDFVQVN